MKSGTDFGLDRVQDSEKKERRKENEREGKREAGGSERELSFSLSLSAVISLSSFLPSSPGISSLARSLAAASSCQSGLLFPLPLLLLLLALLPDYTRGRQSYVLARSLTQLVRRK